MYLYVYIYIYAHVYIRICSYFPGTICVLVGLFCLFIASFCFHVRGLDFPLDAAHGGTTVESSGHERKRNLLLLLRIIYHQYSALGLLCTHPGKLWIASDEHLGSWVQFDLLTEIHGADCSCANSKALLASMTRGLSVIHICMVPTPLLAKCLHTDPKKILFCASQ